MPRDVLFPDDLTQVELPDGKAFTVYTELDRLEEHMIERFPSDRRATRRYVSAARSLARHDLPELPLTGARGVLGALPAVPKLFRWGRVSMQTAAAGFRDPFLRRAFPTIQYDWPDLPVLVHLNMLAQCSIRNYGFPAGGSLEFSRSLERRYRELGGEIAYGARVEKILTEGDRGVGVRLADGTEHRSDAVISNAFSYTTIFELLGGRFAGGRIRAQNAKPVDTMTMGIHVSLGVARDLSNEPHALVLLLDRPAQLADQTLDRVPVELFGFDPSLAPAGKGVIKVLLNTSYTYWDNLSEDRSRYDGEKEKLVDAVIATLGPRFPGLRDQIEVTDVATPLTTERYTGNGRTYTSESEKVPIVDLLFSRPKTLPGLKRVYLVGQSAGGAGIPGCAAMGRAAVRAACRELGTRFATP